MKRFAERKGARVSNQEIAQLVHDGARALVEGRRDEAQRLLMRAIELDDQHELAWLWVSGTVDDPAEQQVALENVLALNPANSAALAGLDWLHRSALSAAVQTAAPVGAPPSPLADPKGRWVPPPPLDENDVLELACWQCGVSLYSVAQFCWQCNAPVRCCNNCAFRSEPRCKQIQGLTTALTQAARNDCPWWRPPVSA